MSVAAGGTATVSTGQGAGVALDVDHWIATDPNGDAKVDYDVVWDDSAAVQAVEFTETSGLTGVSVGYEVKVKD